MALIEHPEPTPATAKELYANAFRCAAPECRRPLYKVDPDTGERTLNSRIAHICARREGGPRWSGTMSEHENRSVSNLVVLCIEHANQIDVQEDRFSPALLKTWKASQLDEFDKLRQGWALRNEDIADVMRPSSVTIHGNVQLGGRGGSAPGGGGGGGGAIGNGAIGGPGGDGGDVAYLPVASLRRIPVPESDDAVRAPIVGADIDVPATPFSAESQIGEREIDAAARTLPRHEISLGDDNEAILREDGGNWASSALDGEPGMASGAGGGGGGGDDVGGGPGGAGAPGGMFRGGGGGGGGGSRRSGGGGGGGGDARGGGAGGDGAGAPPAWGDRTLRTAKPSDVENGLCTSVFAADVIHSKNSLLYVLGCGWAFYPTAIPGEVWWSIAALVSFTQLDDALTIGVEIVDPDAVTVCLEEFVVWRHQAGAVTRWHRHSLMHFRVAVPGVWTVRLVSGDVVLSTHAIEIRPAA